MKAIPAAIELFFSLFLATGLFGPAMGISPQQSVVVLLIGAIPTVALGAIMFTKSFVSANAFRITFALYIVILAIAVALFSEYFSRFRWQDILLIILAAILTWRYASQSFDALIGRPVNGLKTKAQIREPSPVVFTVPQRAISISLIVIPLTIFGAGGGAMDWEYAMVDVSLGALVGATIWGIMVPTKNALERPFRIMVYCLASPVVFTLIYLILSPLQIDTSQLEWRDGLLFVIAGGTVFWLARKLLPTVNIEK